MCFLFPVTLEKTWSSQRIGMKTTQQAFFILIFMTGGRGVTPLQVSVKFREGRPLGVTGSKGKTRARVLGRGQVSTHLTPHASQHVPTVRCKPWEKAGFVWDTGSAKSSPLLSKQLLLFIVFSKEAFCCLIKCSPLVSSL